MPVQLESPHRFRERILEPEWQATIDWLADTVREADPEHDWIVLDSISPTWEFVQSWYSQQVHGSDLAEMMVRVRRESANMAAFNANIVGEMTWPLIKREYSAKLYRPLQKWRGHLILTAQAKDLGKRDREDDTLSLLYGHIGFKPTGEGQLHHVASTNLFLDHPKHGVFRFTTVKDRNREEVDKQTYDDFAVDYLQEIAGWEPVVVKKGAAK